jgi:hypothetical protein
MRWLLILTIAACGGKREELTAATITIGAQKLELKGAVVHGTHVIVSTGPLDCSQPTLDAQVVLARGELGWTLGGTLFPQIITAKDEAMKGVTLEIGQGTVALGGNGIMGGQKIELAGTLVALDCPAD